MWESTPAHTYAKGPVCIIGDAAHYSCPFLPSGPGMSCEDSLILSTLLGNAGSSAGARVALSLYDQAQRPYTQRTVEMSKEVAMLALGLSDFDINTIVHEPTKQDLILLLHNLVGVLKTQLETATPLNIFGTTQDSWLEDSPPGQNSEAAEDSAS